MHCVTTPLPTDSALSLQEMLVKFYQELNLFKLRDLSSIYSEDIEFSDPITSHTGLNRLSVYFSELLENCLSCKFDITDYQMDDNQGWMCWTMFFAHPKLNAGKPIKVEGTSILKIKNDKICYQRDFYDMGAMIYEKLPIIGRLITFLRRRIA